MCLAIPGRLVDTFEESGLKMGKVDFGGVKRKVCLEHVPHAERGCFVLVHVGFALSVVDEEEARRTLDVLRELDAIEEALG